MSIRFFNDREVRAVWDEEHSKWWFSATDIVRAINDEDDYKKSEVCLNEMGAAWLLIGVLYLSFYLVWDLINLDGSHYIYEKDIKICKKDDVVSLCQKIAKLLQINALNRMNAIYTYIDRFMNLIHRDYRMSIGTFDE